MVNDAFQGSIQEMFVLSTVTVSAFSASFALGCTFVQVSHREGNTWGHKNIARVGVAPYGREPVSAINCIYIGPVSRVRPSKA